MKHNDVLFERLTSVKYYIPEDYMKSETNDEMVLHAIKWFTDYAEKMEMYIDSLKENEATIELDKYIRKLLVQKIRLMGVRNKLIDYMRNHNLSSIKLSLVISKGIWITYKAGVIMDLQKMFGEL